VRTLAAVTELPTKRWVTAVTTDATTDAMTDATTGPAATTHEAVGANGRVFDVSSLLSSRGALLYLYSYSSLPFVKVKMPLL
jgi:hypothetical protein